MGDPRRLKAKYQGPRHPWQSARILEEKALVYQYGLKTKRELWKVDSKLKAFGNQAKRLVALGTNQAEVEKKQLIDRLARLGVLSSGASLDDVLSLTVNDILERRLQTVIQKQGLARTHKQARQFIVHGHIMVGDKKLSAPSYLVPVEEETKLSFVARSSFANPEHPERTIKAKPKPEPKVVEKDQRGRRPRKPLRRAAPRRAPKSSPREAPKKAEGEKK